MFLTYSREKKKKSLLLVNTRGCCSAKHYGATTHRTVRVGVRGGCLVVAGGEGVAVGGDWGNCRGRGRTSYHHCVLGNQSHGLRALIGQLAGHLQVDGGALQVGFGDGCGDHGDGG